MKLLCWLLEATCEWLDDKACVLAAGAIPVFGVSAVLFLDWWQKKGGLLWTLGLWP